MSGTPANVEEIARQLRRGESSPPVLVRVLLSWFGNKGRGSTVVQTIRTSLASVGLRTVPDFAVVHLDAVVSFEVADPLAASSGEDKGQRDSQSSATTEAVEDTQVGTRVGMLPSATAGITAVGPDDPLEKAITLMMLNDFSQLPVMSNERTVKGVVSWKTIGEVRTRKSCTHQFVRECMRRDYELVRVEQPLLDVLPKIIQAEFVLVVDPTNRVTGIVTTTDVSEQFSVMAEPYILLGEVENHLRQLIGTCVSEEEIKEAGDPRDTRRAIQSVDDLTFGEYERLLQNPQNWARLPFDLSRESFAAKLAEIRNVRNDVMHFSQDGIGDAERTSLRSLAHCLQTLASRASAARNVAAPRQTRKLREDASSRSVGRAPD